MTTQETKGGVAEAAGEHTKGYIDAGVDVANTVSCKARQIGQSADDCIRSNPWIAIGVAAGVGLLAGYLMRDRRSRSMAPPSRDRVTVAGSGIALTFGVMVLPSSVTAPV